MSTMAFHFISTSKIWNVFLVGKVKINNEWKNEVNINNLEIIRDLSVISKEEFRSKVTTIIIIRSPSTNHV